MRYKITCSEAIEQVLSELDGPIDETEFVERVLQLWPSQAKNPQQSVKNQMRYRHDVARLADGQLAPTSYIFDGTRFRLQLNPQERELGGPLAERFTGFMMPPIIYATPQFTDARTGRPIPYRTVEVSDPDQPDWQWNRTLAYDLGSWLEEVGYQPEDSLIFEIRDFRQRDFVIRYEPAAARQEDQIVRQNERLATALQQILRYGSMFPMELVRQLYTSLPTRREYPGDPWSLVVRSDSRFSFTDFGDVTLGPAPPGPPSYRSIFPSFPEDEAHTVKEQRSRDKFRGELQDRYQEFQREYASARRAALQNLSPAARADEAHAGRFPTRRLARRRSDEVIRGFDKHLQRQGLSASSRDLKRKDLERFSEFLAERHRRSLDRADFDLMEEFFFQWYLRTADRPSTHVLRRLFTSFNQFFGYWAEEGHPEPAQSMQAVFALKDWAQRKLELVQQLPSGEEYEELREEWLGKPPRRRLHLQRPLFPFPPLFWGPMPEDRPW